MIAVTNQTLVQRNRMTAFDGLPSHVLLAHFLVVMVPLTALLE
ncbi:MAG: hypothetical protein QOF67_2358 [Mycobacterium sp.]|jgi:hypothetical protein|nr:hypothetical protein [Mycobacterium sp.]